MPGGLATFYAPDRELACFGLSGLVVLAMAPWIGHHMEGVHQDLVHQNGGRRPG